MGLSALGSGRNEGYSDWTATIKTTTGGCLGQVQRQSLSVSLPRSPPGSTIGSLHRTSKTASWKILLQRWESETRNLSKNHVEWAKKMRKNLNLAFMYTQDGIWRGGRGHVSWSLDFGIPLTRIGCGVQGWISFDSNHSLTFYALNPALSLTGGTLCWFTIPFRGLITTKM